jgi:hypothetical protein
MSATVDAPSPPAAKPKRETWLDWVAPVPEDEAVERAQPLLKTDELLAALADEGVKASRWDLSYWQRHGVIPYPTKQRNGQAEWAIYPGWMVDLVRLVRTRQAQGGPAKRLDNMIEFTRSSVRRTLGRSFDDDEQHWLETKGAYRRYRAALEAAGPSLELAAKEFEQATGRHIGRIEIVLHIPPEDDFTRIDVMNPGESGAPVWWRLKDAPR